MNGSRNVWIGGGVVAIVIGVLVALWVAGQPDPVEAVAVDVGAVDGERVARGPEGLVRGKGARRRIRRRLRGPGGAPQVRGAAARVNDTAPTGEEDTGVTREMLIDEMIEDVAQDTGMTEEEKRRMQEALLRVRDADVEGGGE